MAKRRRKKAQTRLSTPTLDLVPTPEPDHRPRWIVNAKEMLHAARAAMRSKRSERLRIELTRHHVRVIGYESRWLAVTAIRAIAASYDGAVSIEVPVAMFRAKRAKPNEPMTLAIRDDRLLITSRVLDRKGPGSPAKPLNCDAVIQSMRQSDCVTFDRDEFNRAIRGASVVSISKHPLVEVTLANDSLAMRRESLLGVATTHVAVNYRRPPVKLRLHTIDLRTIGRTSVSKDPIELFFGDTGGPVMFAHSGRSAVVIPQI